MEKLHARELWLEVSVRSQGDRKFDVLPRVPIASVPFATRAAVADEVDWSNVKNWPQGLRGETGSAGASVVAMSIPLQHSECPQGGVSFSLGGSTSYVCNGATGAVGPAGAQGAVGPIGATGAQGPIRLQGPWRAWQRTRSMGASWCARASTTSSTCQRASTRIGSRKPSTSSRPPTKHSCAAARAPRARAGPWSP